MPAAVACTISTTGLLEAVTALVGLGLTTATVKVVSQGSIATVVGTLVSASDVSASVDSITGITAGSRPVRLGDLKAVLAAVPSSVATVALAFFDAANGVSAYWTLTYSSNPQRVITLPNRAPT